MTQLKNMKKRFTQLSDKEKAEILKRYNSGVSVHTIHNEMLVSRVAVIQVLDDSGINYKNRKKQKPKVAEYVPLEDKPSICVGWLTDNHKRLSELLRPTRTHHG